MELHFKGVYIFKYFIPKNYDVQIYIPLFFSPLPQEGSYA
jgi:hypothetical protein